MRTRNAVEPVHRVGLVFGELELLRFLRRQYLLYR